VIAHPYDTAGNASAAFEVLQLSTAGALTRFAQPKTFMLSKRAPFGVMAFTPDAKVGLVALDDGKVGVFSLDADGNPTVIDPGFSGGFYADRVVMDPSGDYAWVVDRNTRENGGGIYRVTVNCDGTLSDAMLFAAANSPGGIGFTGDGQAVVAARDILGGPAGGGADVHLLNWSTTRPPMLLDGADAFGDNDIIFSGFAMGPDAVVVGDSNVTGTNRVAAAGFNTTQMYGGGVIASDITDPSGIAISPFARTIVVTSSQPPGEGIYVLASYDGTVWTKNEVTYNGAAPQLPGDLVTIDRGSLKGSVLVSELSKVRRLLFHSDDSVTDEGSLALGGGLENVAGAIGVTP